MKITFLGLLALVFITLKLTNVIDWSWLWVTCPLWGGLAIALAIILFVKLIFQPVLWCYFKLFRKKEFEQLKAFEKRRKQQKSGLAEKLRELEAEKQRIIKERAGLLK